MFIAIVAALTMVVGGSTGATTVPNQLTPPKCSHVSAHKWNVLVRTERKLDGHSTHRIARHRVCVLEYKAFKRHVQEVRADCLREARNQGGVASNYGKGDGFMGGPLACGGTLTEGTMGAAHKYLPCGKKIWFKYGSRVQLGRVVDRGPFVGGRVWDLTPAMAGALGNWGNGSVLAGSHNCWFRTR